MKLLFLGDFSLPLTQILHNAIKQTWEEREIVLCQDTGSFMKRLRENPIGETVSLAVIHRQEELESIKQLGNPIFKTKLILILPDEAPEMTVLAHTLRPRFVSYFHSALREITQVLPMI